LEPLAFKAREDSVLFTFRVTNFVKGRIKKERRFEMMRKPWGVLFISLITVVFCIGTNIKVAAAQEDRFPSKPIRIIIGDGPGGATDLPTRALAKATENILGQPIVCYNTPGASGTRALAQVLHEKPDGYTLVAINGSAHIASIVNKLGFTIPDDFPPVIQFHTIPMPVAVKKDSAWKTWQEFIKYAREQKEIVSIGIFGRKGTNWLTLHQIEKMEDVKFVYVPFSTAGENAAAILGGHITASMIVSSIVYAKSGQLKLLLVFSDQRLKSFPDVPTAKEVYGPEGVAFGGGFGGILAPKGLPTPILTKLHDAFKKGMEDQGFLKVIESFDQVISYKNSEEFAKMLKRMVGVVTEFMTEEGK
jgi:tripartite-type tricarboxylate transporter receptor subunit TctC